MPLWSPTTRKNSRGSRACGFPTGPYEWPTLLPEDEPGAPRIGSAVENAVAGLNHHRRRAVAPFTRDLSLMAQRVELLNRGGWDAGFQPHHSGYEFVAGEGAIEVLSLETRRFHGFLWRHAEIEDVEQRLEQGLVLIVAARRGHLQIELPVLGDDGRAKSYARTLAGSELIG